MGFNSAFTREVDECPACFKEHTDLEYRYVDIYLKRAVVARVALGIVHKECILHGVVEKWTAKAFKAITLGFFGAIVPGLKEMGVEKIAVVEYADRAKKLSKFLQMLHFSKPQKLMYQDMEI